MPMKTDNRERTQQAHCGRRRSAYGDLTSSLDRHAAAREVKEEEGKEAGHAAAAAGRGKEKYCGGGGA